MTIYHNLTAANNSKRVKIVSTGTDPIIINVGDPAQTWPEGTFIEVVRVSTTTSVQFQAFDISVTLNALTGGEVALADGEYGRVSLVSPGVWDLHVYKIPVPPVPGVTTLGGLTDVDNFAYAPHNGDVLTYNSGSNLWVAAAPANTLDGLSDVTISSPVTNQVLTFDGSIWVNQASSGSVYQPVKAVTLGNIALSGAGGAIDGQVMLAGDRVLVRAQSTASQNGIYVVQSGAWTRATDWAAGTTKNSGEQIWCAGGNVYGYAVLVTLAGTSAFVVGSASVSFFATITSGTSPANGLDILRGGTGATTAAGAINNLLPTQTSAAGRYLATDGTNPSWVQPVVKPAPMTPVTISGTTYNMGSAAHHNNHFRTTSVTAVAITVQPDSFWTGTQQYWENNFNPPTPGPIPIGGSVIVGKHAAGDVTFVAGSGVTINTPDTLVVSRLNGKITLIKVAANVWDIEGNLASV